MFLKDNRTTEKLTKELKRQSEKHDEEILSITNANLNEKIQETKKRKKPYTKKSSKKKTIEKNNEDNLPINEYLAQRDKKIRRNKNELRRLGLGTPKNSPEHKDNEEKNCSTTVSKEIVKDYKKPKNVPIIKRVPESRSKRKGKKKRGRRIVFDPDETESESDNEVCMHNHENISEYCKENNKRYFSEKYNLSGAICADCNKNIVAQKKINCIVATVSAPVHVCMGRIQYRCKHCLCHSCYLKKSFGEGRRRRSNNN